MTSAPTSVNAAASARAAGRKFWPRSRRELVDTQAVIATVDAALAAAIAVLAVKKAEATTILAVAAGFLVAWTALFLLERQTLRLLRRTKPRFPTPPDES